MQYVVYLGQEINEGVTTMKHEKVFKYYATKSKKHQLIGNHGEVIVEGSKKECYARMNIIDIESSKWGIVEVVSPGQNTSGTLLKPIYGNETCGIDIYNL